MSPTYGSIEAADRCLAACCTTERGVPNRRTDRLESGRRRIVRPLVIDLGVDLGIGNCFYPWVVPSHAALADSSGRWQDYCLDASPIQIVTVPADFVTDFSSIPAIFRPAYRFDKVDVAGCCHDLAYRIGVPRGPADRIWRVVSTSGHRRVTRPGGAIGWLGLRLGGWYGYDPPGNVDPLHAVDAAELVEIRLEEAA